MLGTFLAQDCSCSTCSGNDAIPLFLIIGIWGGERRIYATLKFVLYTAFGSILMLAAVIYSSIRSMRRPAMTSFAFADLYRPSCPCAAAWLFTAFALSFAIKVPIVPLHTWLPDAHVEAPTAGSVILAGVLLKMGTYGFMKLAFPLFPDATRLLAPVFQTLAVISILYGACLALVQTDIKKIIAYSSISHLGYVMLGLVSLDLLGIQGAVVQMVSHGLIAGGLFLMVGMIYERCHTRELAAYGGLAKLLPLYSGFFALLTLAAIGLPTTSGFTGEFLVLLGAFRAAWPQYVEGAGYPLLLSASAVAGVALGALYMLGFAQHFLFGGAKAPYQPLHDLNLREYAILGALSWRSSHWAFFRTSRCARPSSPQGSTSNSSREVEAAPGWRPAWRHILSRVTRWRPRSPRATPATDDELARRTHGDAPRALVARRDRAPARVR